MLKRLARCVFCKKILWKEKKKKVFKKGKICKRCDEKRRMILKLKLKDIISGKARGKGKQRTS